MTSCTPFPASPLPSGSDDARSESDPHGDPLAADPGGPLIPRAPLPSRGRRRDEDVQERALAATRRIAENRPYSKVSMSAIAKEAHASKATLYRWWPSKCHLVYDAIFDCHWSMPATGDLQSDLQDLIEQYVQGQFDERWERLYLGMWADLSEEANTRERQGLPKETCRARRHQEEFIELVQRVCDRAVRNGELRRRVDAEWLYGLMIGSLGVMTLLEKPNPSIVPTESIVHVLSTALLNPKNQVPAPAPPEM